VSRFLSGDTLLRVVSLGLAIVLWVVIAGRYTAERGLTVPVELRNFPPDLELTGDLVNSVNVRLRASPGLVESLDPRQVLVRIDLQGAEEGEHIIQLTSEYVEVPFGFRVVKITPSLLTINLERSLSKTLPVRPRILGQPAPGYEVEKVTSEPAEVRIRGPRSRVQEIESAFTEPVSIEGADATVEEYVNVGLEDPLLNLESEEGQEVKVVVHIRERQEQKTFDSLPVVVRGQPARLSPSTVRVEVQGPERVLSELDPDDVRPYVNVPPDHDGAQALPVAVEIAPGHTGASVVRTEPAEVKARPLPARRQP
jgi:YbbR domain-containing protein